jgi:hypothetical protein
LAVSTKLLDFRRKLATFVDFIFLLFHSFFYLTERMGGLRGRGTIFKGDFFIWTKTKTAFAKKKKKMLRHSAFAFLHRRLKPEQSYKKLSYQILLDANPT